MYLLTGRIPCESHHKLNYIVGELKKHLEEINKNLEGRDYLVGKSITLADIQLATFLRLPLSLAINPPFRNKVLNLMNWYYRITSQDGHFESTFGKLKL
jgi:glutathione S-transferase